MASYRDLPSVEAVLSSELLVTQAHHYPHEWLANLVRERIAEGRKAIGQGGGAPTVQEVAQWVVQRVSQVTRPRPQAVINATGVVIHTNLGRSPLSEEAVEAMVQASERYSDLELDIDQGKRGSRQAHLQPVLRQLTGAEAGLAVNNNASAVLLGLLALCQGKEVIVSRGEAVEIGGGFRIPEVLSQSGANLVEVGTTNRTYAADYEAAITPNTGALLKVHASNFRVVGFTASAEAAELVAIGKRHGVPVLHDVGSGCLLPTESLGLAHEPTPQESIEAGVDLVFFSGDKLLGGPQAGVVVGQQELVRRLERHPLARAVRIDKATLAALHVTLIHYLKGEARSKIPVWQMLGRPEAELKEQAAYWCQELGPRASIVPGLSTIGGGSLPGETLPTHLVRIDCRELPGNADGLMAALRRCQPPIIGRIEADRVVLDPRTVAFDEEKALLRGVKGALAGEGRSAGG